MDPDIQSAESNKYGDRVLMLLALPSGRVAVMNDRREIIAIAERDEAIQWLPEWKPYEPPPPPPRSATISLEDLGL